MITRNSLASRKPTPKIKNHHNNREKTLKNCTVVLNDVLKPKPSADKPYVKPCKVVLNDCCKTNVVRTTQIETKKNDFSSLIKPCKVVLENVALPKRTLNDDVNLGDGRASGVYKCKSKRCMLKEFAPRDKALRSCTKRSYQIITPPGTVYLNCHSSNLVYLLSCSTCGLQYVGETVQNLSTRFNGHRIGLKTPQKYGTCKILTTHFNSGLCKDSAYTVQILEKLEGNGRTVRNAIDVGVTSHRRARETFWIKTLLIARYFRSPPSSSESGNFVV